MIRISDIRLSLNYNSTDIKNACAKALKISPDKVTDVFLVKKGIDARRKNDVHFSVTADVSVKSDEQIIIRKSNSSKIMPAKQISYELPKSRSLEKPPVVVGLGPAGLFCGYILALCGAKPVLIERGCDVDKRKKITENFNKTGILNENCNIQFGEGGAGTFSDGKLNTGIKDKRIRFVLKTLVKFGAPEEILYSAKPHVGTDRLAPTVKNLRNEIIRLGGQVYFETVLKDLVIKDGALTSVITESGGNKQIIETDTVVLSVGHSARDTFKMLKSHNAAMEQKPFSVGARIEHLRENIDKAQYGSFAGSEFLGAADYKLSAHLKSSRGVYTFCMCPGGEVVAAASEKNRLVTNGMSRFARNSVNSNSALLVGVNPDDFKSEDVLAGIEFQRTIEEAAFRLGGENYCAPVQRVEDFLNGKSSVSVGEVKPSYPVGWHLADIRQCLPEYVWQSMAEGIRIFGSKLKGFDSGDAILTAPETRSSSPVRILRGSDMQSVNIRGLYPCGEGAGYAGGITSAAVDGIKCAEQILSLE